MTRGFLRGTASGLVLCLVALTLTTLVGAPPRPPAIDVTDPGDEAGDAPAGAMASGTSDDGVAVARPSPLSRAAPEPDTIGGVAGEAVEPSGGTPAAAAGAASPAERSLGDAPAQPAMPDAVPAESAFAPVAVPPAHERREAAVVPDASFRPEVSTDIAALRAPDATPPASAFPTEPGASEPRRQAEHAGPSDAAPTVAAEPPRQPVSALETAPTGISGQDDPTADLASVESAGSQGETGPDGVPSGIATDARSSPLSSSQASNGAADRSSGDARARGTVMLVGGSTAMTMSDAIRDGAASEPRALVLVDDGSGASDAARLHDALSGTPFPVAIAVDPSRADASEQAAFFRAAGHEILVLMTGSVDGPTAEMTRRLRARLDAIPDAVGVLHRGPASLEALDWLAATVGAEGRGLLVQSDATASGLEGGGFPGDPLYRKALSASDDAGSAVVWRGSPPGSAVWKGQPGAVLMPLDPDAVGTVLRDAPSLLAEGRQPVALEDILKAARP